MLITIKKKQFVSIIIQPGIKPVYFKVSMLQCIYGYTDNYELQVLYNYSANCLCLQYIYCYCFNYCSDQ